MRKTRAVSTDWRLEIERSGYYPALVIDAVASALGSETAEAFVVHHEATFDPGMEVRRHISVLLLTPTRLVVCHTDEHPPVDANGRPHASTTTESVRLDSIQSVALTRVVPDPAAYVPGTLPSEAVLSINLAVNWGSIARIDLEPAACADESASLTTDTPGDHRGTADLRGQPGRRRPRGGRQPAGVQPGASRRLLLDDRPSRGRDTADRAQVRYGFLADLGPSPRLLGRGGEQLLGLPEARRACVLMVDGLGWRALLAHRDRAPFLASLAEGAHPSPPDSPARPQPPLTTVGTGLSPAATGHRRQLALPEPTRSSTTCGGQRTSTPWSGSRAAPSTRGQKRPG